MKRYWLALIPCFVGCAPAGTDHGNAAAAGATSQAGSAPAPTAGSPPGGASGGGTSASGGMGSAGTDDPGVGVLPGGVSLDGKPVYYRIVRLTHEQWENAARVALQLPAAPGLSSGFSPDPPDGKYGNNERALYLTSGLWADYQRAAEELAQRVVGDAAALAQLGSAADSGAFIRNLGRAAFRRALRADEEQRYATLMASGPTLVGSGNAFSDGAFVVISAMLQSPSFLYRIELTPNGARLSGSELASKLSFLLRESPPDRALAELAESGALAQDGALAQVASDLVAGEAITVPINHFFGEWFSLERYTSILKDKTLFPTYAESLNASLLASDRRFFQHVFESGGGLRDILTTRVAYVDAATAPLYGLSAPGAGLSQVTLDEGRPGFFTRVGFLANNATMRDPDPIHRGVDIIRRVLCIPLDPPAGEIPPLPPFVPGQTNRERVAAHTGEGSCAGCHRTLINPLGFAFEAFDALGQARTMDNGKPIDTRGEFAFADGTKGFAGPAELAKLLGDSQQAHGCYAANVAEFALARDLGGLDEELVTSLQAQSLQESLSVKDALLAVVQSKAFTVALGGSR
jgi:Protein of unknown function (DUF1592)/Protein of unknown function (DUF1588)/Protein of unknown function (DUF1595)/Protein of unknown function (DUF1585)/Protein of unknown function (DUF1587)